MLEIGARTVSHDMAVDQRMRTNQEDKQQIRQHAITTHHSLSSFAVRTLRLKAAATQPTIGKKSRLNSGKNPDPVGKLVCRRNTGNQCLSRSRIRLDENHTSPTMGKNPPTRGKKSFRKWETGFARPGGADGEKRVWKDRAHRGYVGLDGFGRRTRGTARDAHAPTAKRDDDPNTCSERHGTNARARSITTPSGSGDSEAGKDPRDRTEEDGC